MKPFILIFVLIVSSECGLLDDLVSLKDEKPKSGVESNRTEYRQGVLIKVRETLKNGTKIVIDALGNVIKISPKENEENTNEKGTPESPKGTEEVVTKDEASEPDPKADLPTSTEKIEAPKVDESTNQTLSSEEIFIRKEAAGNVNNSSETPNPDGNTSNNCTNTDGTECKMEFVVTKSAFKGDECPSGKRKADDGTCVEEV